MQVARSAAVQAKLLCRFVHKHYNIGSVIFCSIPNDPQLESDFCAVAARERHWPGADLCGAPLFTSLCCEQWQLSPLFLPSLLEPTMVTTQCEPIVYSYDCSGISSVFCLLQPTIYI